jgi:hypothetical protein
MLANFCVNSEEMRRRYSLKHSNFSAISDKSEPLRLDSNPIPWIWRNFSLTNFMASGYRFRLAS